MITVYSLIGVSIAKLDVNQIMNIICVSELKFCSQTLDINLSFSFYNNISTNGCSLWLCRHFKCIHLPMRVSNRIFDRKGIH